MLNPPPFSCASGALSSSDPPYPHGLSEWNVENVERDLLFSVFPFSPSCRSPSKIGAQSRLCFLPPSDDHPSSLFPVSISPCSLPTVFFLPPGTTTSELQSLFALDLFRLDSFFYLCVFSPRSPPTLRTPVKGSFNARIFGTDVYDLFVPDRDPPLAASS